MDFNALLFRMAHSAVFPTRPPIVLTMARQETITVRTIQTMINAQKSPSVNKPSVPHGFADSYATVSVQ